jgi:hypothetical protein
MPIEEMLDKIIELSVDINYKKPHLVLYKFLHDGRMKTCDVVDVLDDMIKLSSYRRKCSCVYYSDNHSCSVYVSLRSALLKPHFSLEDFERYLLRNDNIVKRIMNDIEKVESSLKLNV